MFRKIFKGIILSVIFTVLFFKQVSAHDVPNAIHMTKNGFEPQNLTVNLGDIVIFENIDSKDHWPASNIHPTHSIYPEFDPRKSIKPSKDWSFKFDKSGNWRFHDHLYPDSTGVITVKGNSQAPAGKSFLSDISSRLKDLWMSVYFKFYPAELEKKLNALNLENFEVDDAQIKEVIKFAGIEKVRDKLLSQSQSGSKFDCHQQAHKLGRMSYETLGGKVFRNMDTTCHSGLIHGAMEAFLQEKGTKNLAADIKKLCDPAETSFGRFECLHGIGHGVMAYEDYNMPQALEVCKSLNDDFITNSCFGGVMMENIIVSEGNGVVAAHQTKWVNSDPYFPCSGIEQNASIQHECYMMQTARMLDLNNHDFKKVAELCSKIPNKDMIQICYQSMGRDAAGQVLRNALKTEVICGYAPSTYYRDCVKGALYVFMEFWGSSMSNQPHELCNLVKKDDQSYCYQLLGGRLPDMFGKDISKIRQICDYSEGYQNTCLKSAGII